ncbi:LamG domain-containing protein [Seonamhaeicola sp.]|uniref:LamG domain-containing protein n=1 Tax=Seonamhaeicola sp. TaxID=1912245 RepID=UPI002619AF32|nr:LamG domain-containing protein [Seonamhaeicola sp.]
MPSKKLTFLFLAICNLLLASTLSAQAQGVLKAYYTKITKQEHWEPYSRTREHADIMVELNDLLKVEFWRGTSYLPVLHSKNRSFPFEEIISRSGDGNKTMPDKTNLYSYVKIIEQTEKKTVIQWKYLPEFHSINPRITNSNLFVIETFTFKENGIVERIIKQGTQDPDAWNDPNYVIQRTYRLSTKGIKLITSKPIPNTYAKPLAAKPSPLLGPNIVEPILWWKFDEGNNKETLENIQKTKSFIKGNKVYWSQGISGTALSLDGYNNFVEHKSTIGNKDTYSFEVWIALAAAPFDLMGILSQENIGLFTDAEGGLHWKSGKSTITAHNALKGNYGKWVHIVGTKDSKAMRLYLNGKETASGKGNAIKLRSDIIKIGHSETLDPNATPYTLEGLIDEFRIYDLALTAQQIENSRINFYPGREIVENPDIEMALIPEGTSKGKFGAHYEKLKYTQRWDNLHRDGDYADIVVEYDNAPVKTIFWRAATYSPFHTNGSKGRFNSEFNENFGPTGPENDCCYEPMSDKKHEFSHARIIENTPARAVVHWRYPLSKPNKIINHTDTSTGWGDISDWYMYCYPDGITAYDMRFWTEDRNNFVEWSEGMILMGPGENPRDVLPFKSTVTNANLTEIQHWDWSTSSRKLDYYSWDNDPNTIKPTIQVINLKGSPYKPFLIFAEENVKYWGPYIHWDRLSHWPVGQRYSSLEVEKDGIDTRIAHFSLLKTIPPLFGEPGGHHKTGTITDGAYLTQVRLEGMTNRNLSELRRLQKSWANAPEIKDETGLSGSYQREQRAFVFTSTADTMTFTLDASETQPLDNPCLVIKHWGPHKDVQLTLNNKAEGIAFKKGIYMDTDGTETMVIYMPFTANTPTHITLKKGNKQQ